MKATTKIILNGEKQILFLKEEKAKISFSLYYFNTRNLSEEIR